MSAPFSVLRRHAERELREGRTPTDVVADLHAKGLSLQEAEGLVAQYAKSGISVAATGGMKLKLTPAQRAALQAADHRRGAIGRICADPRVVCALVKAGLASTSSDYPSRDSLVWITDAGREAVAK